MLEKDAIEHADSSKPVAMTNEPLVKSWGEHDVKPRARGMTCGVAHDETPRHAMFHTAAGNDVTSGDDWSV